jgi:2'-5' RNA ligase
MNSRDGVRLFFALTPDATLRERLSAAAAELPLEATARRVAPCDFHVTIAFVGEVARVHLLTVAGIGAVWARRAAPVTLRFDAYEYWPKPEVVVAAARAVPDDFQRLWAALHADLAAHGWALHAKRLRPHVTLARNAPQAPVLPALSPFEWPVSDFSLLRSDLSDGPPVYTVLAIWPLLDEPGKA